MLYISLNKDVYLQTVGELPDCYLAGCTVSKATTDMEITEADKTSAIEQYWIKAKGTGGYKRKEKLSTQLFNFSLV